MIINTVGLRCKRFERESRLTKAASQISGVGTIGHLSTTKIESKPHTMAASRTGRGETGASEPSLHIRTTGARAEATPTAVLGRLGGALMGLPRGQEPQRTPPPLDRLHTGRSCPLWAPLSDARTVTELLSQGGDSRGSELHPTGWRWPGLAASRDDAGPW